MLSHLAVSKACFKHGERTNRLSKECIENNRVAVVAVALAG